MHQSNLTSIFPLLAILLTAITIWHFEHFESYAPTSENLLPEWQEWQGVAPGEYPELVLANQDPAKTKTVRFTWKLPTDRPATLQFRASTSAISIVPGDRGRQRARIIISSQVPDRKRHTYHKMLVSMVGTESKKKFIGNYKVPVGAESVGVQIQLVKATGSFVIHDVSLITIQKTKRAVYQQYFLSVLWIALIIALLLRMRSGRFPVLATIILIVVSAPLLLPQQTKTQVEKKIRGITSLFSKEVDQTESESATPIQKKTKVATKKIESPTSAWQPCFKWLSKDRLSHAALFFVATLALLMWLPLIQTAFTMTIYAGATEALQHFSPGRTPDPIDFYANECGVIVALLIYLVFYGIRKRILKARAGLLVVEQ